MSNLPLIDMGEDGVPVGGASKEFEYVLKLLMRGNCGPYMFIPSLYSDQTEA